MNTPKLSPQEDRAVQNSFFYPDGDVPEDRKIATHDHECFYCNKPASEVCSACGASICRRHSTEDATCYNREDKLPLHPKDESVELDLYIQDGLRVASGRR